MTERDSYFETRLSYEPERDVIWKVIVGYLQRYIPDNANVLDLGAGYCSFINHVIAKSRHALDKSDIIKEYAEADVITHIGNCTDLRQFGPGQFDVVFSSFLYEHLTRSELNRVMSQLRKILKPGGILLTLLPNFKYIARHYFDDYTHIQIFSHLSFADYVTSQGFTVTDVQGRFLPYSFKSRLPKSPLLTKLYLALPFRPMAGNMLVVAVNNATPIHHKKQINSTPVKKQPNKHPPAKKQSNENQSDDPELSVSLQSQLPEKGVRHGRKARRSPVAHYGVELDEIPSDTTQGVTDVQHFEIKPPVESPGPIKPSEVRTRKKRNR